MRRLLALGALSAGGVIAARRFLLRQGARSSARPGRTTIRQRMMARMLEGMPSNSPPKLVMTILPRLQQQNDEIIALLRDQNELLRSQSQRATRESEKAG